MGQFHRGRTSIFLCSRGRTSIFLCKCYCDCFETNYSVLLMQVRDDKNELAVTNVFNLRVSAWFYLQEHAGKRATACN